ncbi:unnamed protein product [Amoebophrya sp. A25]|nr:unnamed protein product [Amoebophrya sp. A25]|eukprot:GSA25T00025655001.1
MTSSERSSMLSTAFLPRTSSKMFSSSCSDASPASSSCSRRSRKGTNAASKAASTLAGAAALILLNNANVAEGQTFTFQMGGGGGGGMGDILSAMMGGGMPMQGPPEVRWPGGVTQKVDSSFEWLINTEWSGKAGTYVFNRDGELGGSVKACAKHEGVCKWSASKNAVFLNTPDTQKTPEQVLKLIVKGTAAYETKDADAKARLDAHQEDELKATRLETAKPAKSTGKPSVITFVKISASGEEDSLLAEDAFAVLDVTPESSPAEIKKSYRKKSVTHHPDKGGDPALFEKIRQAYEILSEPEKKDYYLQGGALLVKNVETFTKEMEGQVAQQMAQLDQQIPKNHPMRAQAEAQIKAQQPSKSQLKSHVEQRLRQEDVSVEVPVTLEELFAGTDSKEFNFPRLSICRGCRADPTSEKCKTCGRCPPEVRQVPKMQGPFMVGSKTVEVESRERCREEMMPLRGLSVPANAADGTKLRSLRNMSHQTPGRLPGNLRLVTKREAHPTYTPVGDDLFTVLTISAQEALFGFQTRFRVLKDPEYIVLDRENKVTQPNEVIRMQRKGMFNGYGGRGDLVIRVQVEFPSESPAEGKVEKQATGMIEEPRLEAESELMQHEGKLWKAWEESKKRKKAKGKKGGKRSEL